jgi:hypothetical protein
VARNSLNYTFGGYVRCPPASFLLLCAFLSSFLQRSGHGRTGRRSWEEQKLAERHIALLPAGPLA